MTLQPFPDNIFSAERRQIRKRITSSLDKENFDGFDVLVLISKLAKTASKLCRDFLDSSPGTLNPGIGNFRIFAGKILGKYPQLEETCTRLEVNFAVSCYRLCLVVRFTNFLFTYFL